MQLSYGEGRAIICWSCFSIFDTRDMNLYPKWRICKNKHGEDDWWNRSYYVLCEECENTDHIKYCPKAESSNSIC
jgi:hypothetical protein